MLAIAQRWSFLNICRVGLQAVRDWWEQAELKVRLLGG